MTIFKILLKYLLPLATPLLEKSSGKAMAVASPLVLSMSRLIAVAFAAVLLREFWLSGVDGWPDASLGIATVLALPVMNAIQRASPDDVVAIARMLLARMPEPSKFDDHRLD